MVSQLFGAVLRAFVVVLVIATPSLLVPGTSEEGAQVVMLVGLVLGVFVALEYSASYPALVEFRDAPPFNRVRILALFVTLFALSLLAGVDASQSSLALVLNALGLLIGKAMDFPFSPLALVLEHLPESVPVAVQVQVQIMAGLALFVSLFALCIFAILIRMQHWPNKGTSFNVWINLPTFDPTTGGDVVTRLTRDARVNIILGFVSPYLLPVIGVMGANHVEIIVLGQPHTLVWALSLWMFVPLSLFMRGLAMGRIANMIREKRARLVAHVDTDAPAAAS